MRLTDQEPDYFDRHRKDHSGRATMLTLAFAASGLLWLAIIAVTLACLA